MSDGLKRLVARQQAERVHSTRRGASSRPFEEVRERRGQEDDPDEKRAGRRSRVQQNAAHGSGRVGGAPRCYCDLRRQTTDRVSTLLPGAV